MDNLAMILLAQAAVQEEGTTAAPATDAPGQPESITQEPGMSENGEEVTPNPNPLMQYLPLILIFIVFYFIMFRGPKKKQQQRKKMLDSMKKGDKVRTIGGIIGTVVDIRDDEVLLKIDENTNTKMRVSRGAVNTIDGAEGSDNK